MNRRSLDPRRETLLQLIELDPGVEFSIAELCMAVEIGRLFELISSTTVELPMHFVQSKSY